LALAEEAPLPRQVRSQVQLGNEELAFLATSSTESYEIKKTGRKRWAIPFRVQFHVFLFSCFPVKNAHSTEREEL